MRRPAGRGDEGFTLVEVLMASLVTTIVLAATTTFFIVSMRTVNQQGSRQAAVQVATDQMEQMRAVQGAAAFAWLSDSANANQTQTRNGLDYTVVWTCTEEASITPCSTSTTVLEPKVTVSYNSSTCPGNRCNYELKTRVSAYGQDPIFQKTT